MKYTTFADETLLYRHPNGETLVQAETAQGKTFVAVTKCGFLTDYPIWDGVDRVRWDNPEWFTKGFKTRAAKIIAYDRWKAS